MATESIVLEQTEINITTTISVWDMRICSESMWGREAFVGAKVTEELRHMNYELRENVLRACVEIAIRISE